MQLNREIGGRYGITARTGVREDRIMNDVAIPAKFMRAENLSLRERPRENGEVYGLGRDNLTLDKKYVFETLNYKDSKGRGIEHHHKRVARELLIEAIPEIKLSEEYVAELAKKANVIKTRYENDCQIGPSLPKVSARMVAETAIPYANTREEIDMGVLRALVRVSPRPVVLPAPEADLLEILETKPRIVLPIPEADYFAEARTVAKVARRATVAVGTSLIEEFLGKGAKLESPIEQKEGIFRRVANWIKNEIGGIIQKIRAENQTRSVSTADSICPTFVEFVKGALKTNAPEVVNTIKSPIPEKFWGKNKYAEFKAAPEEGLFGKFGWN